MTNLQLFETAKTYIPGGVNSPVRAFNSVSVTPPFLKKGEGAYVYDVEGNKYLDFVGSWGPMILGHNHPQIREAVSEAILEGLSFGAATEKEIILAKLLCYLGTIDMVRLVNSGTEAVMSAIRLARGYTGKDKIIKFRGCYHGHADSMLVTAGSGAMTHGIPDSLGVPKAVAQDTLTAEYNDIEGLTDLFEKNKNQIAAVIIEPIAANMGVILPKEGFLSQVESLCRQNNTLLILDEVITGFRLGIGGAAGAFQISPDLVTYGKIIGGGLPVGAYGGKKEIMEYVAPSGGVYQAGTLSGNPIATAAGIAQLTYLKDHPEVYHTLETLGNQLAKGLLAIKEEYDLPLQISQYGSLVGMFFTAEKEVTNYTQARQSNTASFAKYFGEMLRRGIYLAPSQFEALFVSAAHTPEDISHMLHQAKESLVTNQQK